MPGIAIVSLLIFFVVAWKTSVSLGEKKGRLCGIALFMLTAAALLALYYRGFVIQEQCFAEKKWTAGAMVWFAVMFKGAGALAVCLVMRILFGGAIGR